MGTPILKMDDRREREFVSAHPNLLLLVADILEVWPLPVARVTSIARTHEEDQALHGTGIHSSGPPWRAIDLAGGVPGELTWDQIREIAGKINALWTYDPQRPALKCVVDKEHRTARGNVSVHCGDNLAVFLRGKSLEDVFKLAEQHLPGGNELRARYANLNTGQQRMNVGNRLRAALKDGLWTIPQ